jgi:hypothetical protein
MARGACVHEQVPQQTKAWAISTTDLFNVSSAPSKWV